MPESPDSSIEAIDAERAVRARHTGAALAVEPALCCPIDYELSDRERGSSASA